MDSEREYKQMEERAEALFRQVNLRLDQEAKRRLEETDLGILRRGQEVKRLQDQIRKLKVERGRLKHSRNSLVPVGRLPTELLACNGPTKEFRLAMKKLQLIQELHVNIELQDDDHDDASRNSWKLRKQEVVAINSVTLSKWGACDFGTSTKWIANLELPNLKHLAASLASQCQRKLTVAETWKQSSVNDGWYSVDSISRYQEYVPWVDGGLTGNTPKISISLCMDKHKVETPAEYEEGKDILFRSLTTANLEFLEVGTRMSSDDWRRRLGHLAQVTRLWVTGVDEAFVDALVMDEVTHTAVSSDLGSGDAGPARPGVIFPALQYLTLEESGPEHYDTAFVQKLSIALEARERSGSVSRIMHLDIRGVVGLSSQDIARLQDIVGMLTLRPSLAGWGGDEGSSYTGRDVRSEEDGDEDESEEDGDEVSEGDLHTEVSDDPGGDESGAEDSDPWGLDAKDSEDGEAEEEEENEDDDDDEDEEGEDEEDED
ncbi:hypothetical protein GLOTRDRAFT_97117 [Gloeophyllum trabeum ATCC 11539]|uniref:Uncharacterized protein n=1 Tax=Gloeophyllum trabeum (strain ATCC 11539 / FP-39264 / Madison 617) TaxID=670483 RepID=S7RCX6_GLOTA|nr:uncharacterized protein GLOTRDRAFT_97117 [Gloeophyllum trabeum ATCC 11539]EPQ50269.1 hypothetical protein GLOTRDRAFT_97117 [Gloeophyllum trabeum ATCC 11539]